jgi:hypothetical protein
MSDTVSPVVGKKYNTRSEGVVGPMERPAGGWSSDVTAVFDGKGWYKSGAYSYSGSSRFDLVSELVPWDATTADGVKGIIAENEFRPVSDEGPVRTVTRQEIISGTYDGVVVSYEHDHRLTVHFMVERPSADTLDRAAAVLTALAGALRDGN